MKTFSVKNKNFLKKLPKSNGVYLFKDKSKLVVYIGRAASLKTRVSSYFRNSAIISLYQRPIERLVNEVSTVSYIKTSNLLEAAVLENNLIKKYLPKYNVRDKDDKSFVYLFFDMKNDFPKPIIIRGRELEKYSLHKGKVLGPYQSYSLLKNILATARQVYPYSTCLPAGRQGVPISNKPCFHYQIKLCLGVCVGEISSKNYKKIIFKLILFLESVYPKTNKKIINDIALMPVAPTGNRFRELAQNRVEGYDISHFQKGEAYGAMSVFVVEGGNNKPSFADYRLFKIREAKIGDDTAALKEILERRLKHSEWSYPNLIVVDGGRQQVNILSGVLKKNGLAVTVVGLSKAGKHSQSAASEDVVIFERGLKISVREAMLSQKKLFQKIRNEAHRFALKALRKANKLSLPK
ncbi:MAG: GIY-YIG nuclease family protein [bacterium]|nr:GIY-YIG nuclease family protein [bacterium]